VERPGPHYVVDTMRIMRERYPQVELIYLMGAIRCAICRIGIGRENFYPTAISWV
jgi:hypothetical protein